MRLQLLLPASPLASINVSMRKSKASSVTLLQGRCWEVTEKLNSKYLTTAPSCDNSLQTPNKSPSNRFERSGCPASYSSLPRPQWGQLAIQTFRSVTFNNAKTIVQSRATSRAVQSFTLSPSPTKPGATAHQNTLNSLFNTIATHVCCLQRQRGSLI